MPDVGHGVNPPLFALLRMPLKESAVPSPGIAHRIRHLLLEGRRRGRGPTNQLELARAAGLSRQTLSNIFGAERITPGAAALIAKALGVPVEQVAPEAVGGQAGGTDVPSALRSQRARVWLADLRAELTRAGAEEPEIEAAIALVTAPEVLTYHVGGKPKDYSEAEALQAMEAIAEGVIRPRLKKRAGKR